MIITPFPKITSKNRPLVFIMDITPTCNYKYEKRLEYCNEQCKERQYKCSHCISKIYEKSETAASLSLYVYTIYILPRNVNKHRLQKGIIEIFCAKPTKQPCGALELNVNRKRAFFSPRYIHYPCLIQWAHVHQNSRAPDRR